MKVRIHRGAHEIGGSCVEVEGASGDRLVLDLGSPLDDEDDIDLPAVSGLIETDPALVGIVISHAHQDHWGLVDQALPEVPLFMGEATHRILSEAAFWIHGLTRRPAGYLNHRVPLDIGPFRITPFLNDHSAFDAYSILVEGDGKRLFYTGDIRGHGRKRAIFQQLLRDPPADIEVLLSEGTNIRPTDAPQVDAEEFASESELELRFAELLRETQGMGLTFSSAQNIDRFVTLFRAARRTGRTFVTTLYAASIARATGNPNIPAPDWPDVRVYVPGWQQAKVKAAGEFGRVEAIKPFRVYEEELAGAPAKWVVAFSRAMAARFEKAGCLSGAAAVWSMWPGYLKDAKEEPLLSFLQQHGIPLTMLHTSGHASIPDLQRLERSMSPDRVVPIHSFGSARFDDVFENVEQHPDGEWWEV